VPLGVDPGEAVPEALEGHLAVRSIRLVGSRASGDTHDLSDWDFVIETDNFAAVERDLPELVAALHPISELWDPYAEWARYMLILRGPQKVDLIFPSERRAWAPAWTVSEETLLPIDWHFWDWALWLEQKRRAGKASAFEDSLGHLYELLLRPLGVTEPPGSLPEAVDAYVAARGVRERELGVRMPRILERAVRPALEG
jgi:predicted nucleotidyltransferase